MTRTCHISYFVLSDKYLPLFTCFHFQIENEIEKSIVNEIFNLIDRVGKGMGDTSAYNRAQLELCAGTPHDFLYYLFRPLITRFLVPLRLLGEGV